MPDIGAPFGFDLSTTLVGSGFTLLVSSAVLQYGDKVSRFTNEELYGLGGAALLALGVVYGLVLVLRGDR